MTAVSAQAGWGRRADWNRLPAEWQQAVIMAVIIVLTAGLSRVAGSAGSRLFYVAAAAGTAFYASRRSPWFFVTMTFWFWTLSPFVRRVIDYNTSFDPVNYVLGAPNLMALFMIKDILTSRELVRIKEALLGLLLLLPIVYGLCVNLVQGDIVPGIAAAADWFTPVIYFYYILAHWRRIEDADHLLRGFLLLNGVLMAAYGIYQYFDPNGLDSYWVTESRMTSIGYPRPYELRVFGTLNAPGPLAFWVGSMLLLLLHFRTRFTKLLVPALILLLLVTLVRSVLGSTVLAVFLAAFMSRTSIFKTLGVIIVAVVLVAGAVSAIDPEMADKLFSRVNSVGDLGTDTSAIERQNLYNAAPAVLNANPLGIGIGGVGRGAVADQNSDMVTLDSGLIVIFLTLGWMAGWVQLVGIAVILAQILLIVRQTSSSAALAFAITAVGGQLNLPFMSVLGFNGVVVWTCAAGALAIGIAVRERAVSGQSRLFAS